MSEDKYSAGYTQGYADGASEVLELLFDHLPRSVLGSIYPFISGHPGEIVEVADQLNSYLRRENQV